LDWNDPDARETNLKLVHLEKRLYRSYEPTANQNVDFFHRLEEWIEQQGLSEQDRLELFKSVPRLFYIGKEEFDELARIAYENIVAEWIVETAGLSFSDPDFQRKLKEEYKNTWFCPITDSLRINSFCHINLISNGVDNRPDWHSLAKYDVPALAIREDMKRGGIKRLVLLEDFVGGGSQVEPALRYASRFSDQVEILFIPLVICPKGYNRCINEFEQDYKLKAQPALILNKTDFIAEAPYGGEPSSLANIRDIAEKTFDMVGDGIQPYDTDAKGKFIKPYHPLGWDNVGGMVIMYSNTPDNTLPLFHWKSMNWVPLFPRHSR
jgi:hypothetical protein